MRYLFMFALFAIIPLISGKNPRVTEKVIMDIEVDNKKIGKIVIGLFGEIVPNTVYNFVGLCKRPPGKGYKRSKIHHIVVNNVIHGGRWMDTDGVWNRGFYKEYFEDENHKLKHYGAGWVASHRFKVVNIDKWMNGSPFKFTLNKLAWRDGKETVFGKVISGMLVVSKMEFLRTFNDEPVQSVVIANCTVEAVEKPFPVKKTASSIDYRM